MFDLKALLEKWMSKEPITEEEVAFLFSLPSKEFAWFMGEYHKRRGCCKVQSNPNQGESK